MLPIFVFKAWVTKTKDLKCSIRFWALFHCRNQGYFSKNLFIFEFILLKIWIFVRMIVCMIWWLHVVELVFLMIFICHTSDLEFNNMFKFEFDFRILKLGFITRMNVLNWNLGVFDSGVISCWFIVGCVPYKICNRLIYSSLTEDAWIEGSCVLKICDVRRKPAMFLANFRPWQGWLMCFDCINKFLVMCRLILDSLVAWGGRNRVLRPHSDEVDGGVGKIANRPL